jgi:hypothetical protein
MRSCVPSMEAEALARSKLTTGGGAATAAEHIQLNASLFSGGL